MWIPTEHEKYGVGKFYSPPSEQQQEETKVLSSANPIGRARLEVKEAANGRGGDDGHDSRLLLFFPHVGCEIEIEWLCCAPMCVCIVHILSQAEAARPAVSPLSTPSATLQSARGCRCDPPWLVNEHL